MSFVVGSGMQLIYKNVLGSAVSSVTISSIAQNFNHLKLIFIGQQSGGISGVFITVNGISTGTYDYESVQGQNASVSGSNGTAQTSWQIGATTTTTNASPGSIYAEFPGYTLTTFNKSYVSYGGLNPQSAGNSYYQTFYGTNRATTAITSMTITAGNGNFVIGSSFYLYGII